MTPASGMRQSMKPPEAVRYSNLTFRLMLCMQTICCRSSVQNTWASPFSYPRPLYSAANAAAFFFLCMLSIDIVLVMIVLILFLVV